MSGTENIVKPIAGDVLDLRRELIDDILLNGLVVKLLSKYLCLCL